MAFISNWKIPFTKLLVFKVAISLSFIFAGSSKLNSLFITPNLYVSSPDNEISIIESPTLPLIVGLVLKLKLLPIILPLALILPSTVNFSEGVKVPIPTLSPDCGLTCNRLSSLLPLI